MGEKKGERGEKRGRAVAKVERRRGRKEAARVLYKKPYLMPSQRHPGHMYPGARAQRH